MTEFAMLTKPLMTSSVYFSTFNDSEKSCSVLEKELRPYLYEQKLKVYSKQLILELIMSPKEPNSRLVCWRLKLEEFYYQIQYKNGNNNTNANAFSRIEIHTKETDDITNLTKYIEDFNFELSRIRKQKQKKYDEENALQNHEEIVKRNSIETERT